MQLAIELVIVVALEQVSNRAHSVLPSSRGSGGLGGASSSPIRASRARLFFSSFRLGGGTYKF